MERYISKDVLITEIERRREINKQCMLGLKNLDYYQGKVDAHNDILSFIDTLEVKDVDLEKEIQDHIKECLDVKFPTTNIELIKKDVAYTAKKFFELGIKASNIKKGKNT